MTPGEIRNGCTYWCRVGKRWRKVVVLGRYHITRQYQNGTLRREERYQVRLTSKIEPLRKLRIAGSLLPLDPSSLHGPIDPRPTGRGAIPMRAKPQAEYKAMP